jgi:hypothetical protein
MTKILYVFFIFPMHATHREEQNSAKTNIQLL